MSEGNTFAILQAELHGRPLVVHEATRLSSGTSSDPLTQPQADGRDRTQALERPNIEAGPHPAGR